VVQTGDQLGLVGSTGLSTGAHLHWEIRVNGLAVDPLQWTEQTFP
jgi:murein DD-endopeptidase MepM/ murein hydrolase activator NlpD